MSWFERWLERRRLRAEQREQERLNECRREDVEEAARVLMQLATPLEALEVARLVVTGASTSFGNGVDSKREMYIQASSILGELEKKLEGVQVG